MAASLSIPEGFQIEDQTPNGLTIPNGFQIEAAQPNTLADKIAAALSKRISLPLNALPLGLQDVATQVGTDELIKTDPNAVAAGFRGAGHGASFGFSPEIMGGIQSLITGKPLTQAIAGQRTTEETAKTSYPEEFTGGSIGGILGTGLVGAETALGQKIAANIGKSGLLGKMLKTGAISGASGALSGAGESPEDRTTGAIAGGGFGAGVGAVIPAVGNATKGAFQSIVNRFIGDSSETAKAISGIPTTLGQRGQDVTQQAFEESALKGTKGKRAQEIIGGFRDKQNEAIENRLVQLKLGNSDTAQEALNGTRSLISAEKKIMRDQVDNAYKLANAQGEASVKAFDLKSLLFDNIKNEADKFNLNLAPKSAEKLKDLAALIKPEIGYDLVKGSTIKPVDFKKLENWRSEVSLLQNEASKKLELSDSKLLGSMRTQFDDFIDTATESALIKGDQKVVDGIIEARGLRREMGKRFESDKIVKRILDNPDFTPEKVTNLIIGAGKLGAKSDSGNTVKALLAAAGNRAPEAQGQIKDAVINRILTRSKTKELTGKEGNTFISPAKLSTNIQDLFDNNKSLATVVFSKDEIKGLRSLQTELGKIASVRPGGSNVSGSGAVITRGIRDIVGNVPLLGPLINGLGDISSASQALRAISQIDELLTPQVAGKAFILSGIASGEQTASKVLTNKENK